MPRLILFFFLPHTFVQELRVIYAHNVLYLNVNEYKCQHRYMSKGLKSVW